MFIISIISLTIAVIALGVMTYFGIEQYRDNTEDEDADKTALDLKRILAGLFIVIIASLGIMAFSHYTEKPANAQSVQIETR
jgi:TRAP-type C4-dicarboxylate transport system permease small subunit